MSLLIRNFDEPGNDPEEFIIGNRRIFVTLIVGHVLGFLSYVFLGFGVHPILAIFSIAFWSLSLYFIGYRAQAGVAWTLTGVYALATIIMLLLTLANIVLAHHVTPLMRFAFPAGAGRNVLGGMFIWAVVMISVVLQFLFVMFSVWMTINLANLSRASSEVDFD